MTTKTESVLLLGDAYVGKSTILDYYMSDRGLSYEIPQANETDTILATISASFRVKTTIEQNGEKRKNTIWDTAG